MACRPELITPQRFRVWCSIAREIWPTTKPVRVRRVDYAPEGATATVVDMGDYHLIKIWKGMCKQAQWEALAHEWCHILRDEVNPSKTEDHDDEFWIIYGSMYRAWETHMERLK